jgi:hypothetical protein
MGVSSGFSDGNARTVPPAKEELPPPKATTKASFSSLSPSLARRKKG